MENMYHIIFCIDLKHFYASAIDYKLTVRVSEIA